MGLFSVSNPKTLKGETLGYRTHILHLAPARLSGHNVCAMASKGCTIACLNTSGMGGIFPSIQAARIRKTKWFFEDRSAFLAQLVKETQAAITSAKKAGITPVFRLNGTSDITWATIPVVVDGTEYDNIMSAFPDTTWYDYTKRYNVKNLPANYHLTLSRSEENEAHALQWLANGGNVAVVFGVAKKDPLPTEWNGYPVIDGMEHDLRFLDPKNVVVGLKALGKAKHDTTGFVVKV